MTQVEKSAAPQAASSEPAAKAPSGGGGLGRAKRRFIDAANAADPLQAVRRHPFVSIAAAGFVGAMLGTRRGTAAGRGLLAVAGTLLPATRSALAAVTSLLEKKQQRK